MIALGSGEFDHRLLGAFRLGDNMASERWIRVVTALGGWKVLAAATVIAAAILIARRRVAAAILLLTAAAGGRALVDLQKWLFGRERPDHALIDIQTYAFPSGHAANATITYLLIAALLCQSVKARRSAIAFAAALSVAIGLSRVSLGVHWPTDVVGGWSFGLLWALAALAVGRRLRLSSKSVSLPAAWSEDGCRRPARHRRHGAFRSGGRRG
jgi:undecaprenyl-diphosphatase